MVHHYPNWGVARLTAEGLRLSKRISGVQSPPQPDDPKLSNGEEKTRQTLLIASFPTPKGTMWENVKIRFLDGDTIRISTGKLRKTYSYAQLGMLRVRSGKKSVNWETLLSLAKFGQIDWTTPAAGYKLKKRISCLRDILKKVMGIEDDPFMPYDQEKCYRPRFDLKDVG